MKLTINKSVYRDSLRRTRMVRIVSLLAGIVIAMSSTDYPHGDAYVSTGLAPMGTAAVGMLVFLFAGEIAIHYYRRRRKWDFFRTLPASRAEWYWSSLLAEITNMAIYITVTELTVIPASFRAEKRLEGNLMPGKLRVYPPEHIHRWILLFVIGLVFLAVLSVIRELAHTAASYLVLLLGFIGGYWMILSLIPRAVRSYSGNFVSVYASLFYRMRLLHRIVLATDAYNAPTKNLETAYDTIAILVNLLLAVLLLLLGRRLTKRSETEYIGAEYRNKSLFYILGVLINLFPLLLISYTAILGNEYTGNLLMVPVLIVLIAYFLLRLFREKLSKRFLGCIGLSVLLAGGITAVTLLYARLGRTIPEREDVIAMRCEHSFYGMVSDEEILDRLYAVLENEHDHPVTERHEYREMKITLYTKYGCREFFIDRDITEVTNDIRRDVPGGVFCSYGKKPLISTQFDSFEEYETFAALLPDWCRKEVPVYYVNALGGLSKSGKTINIGVIDLYRARIQTPLMMQNSFSPQNAVYCSFPPDTEAAAYYHEKVCLPQKRAKEKTVRENPTQKITVVLRKEEDTYNSERYKERWYYTVLSFTATIENGTFRQKSGSGTVTFPEEYLKTMYDVIFGPEETITAGMETVMVTVMIRDEEAYSFFVPAERLKEILQYSGDERTAEQKRREEEWQKRTEEQQQEGEGT